MKKRLLRLGLVLGALAAVAGSGTGQAVQTTCAHNDATPARTANSITITDGANCVLEPILTRSDKASVYVKDTDPDELAEANITRLSVTATSGKIVANITTAQAIPVSASDFVDGAPGDTRPTDVRPPYGGVHVLVLFQSDTLEEEQATGTNASGGTVTFGPLTRADNWHWFLYYGTTLSEGGIPTCGVGFYNQFGQVFTVFSQSLDKPQNYTCVNNQATRTITLTFPYQVTWTIDGDRALARRLQVVRLNQRITNIKGFAWMDHEIGGPPPIGLVLGLTWYNDVIPSNGYDFGLIAGDPNSGGIPGPKCQQFPILGRIPNPLYDPANPACFLQMPTVGGEYTGLGMRGTAAFVTAI